LPQLRLEQGWSVDVGEPWPLGEPRGLKRRLGKLKPGPGASAAKVAAHQVDRIHDAMLELVAERGYGAVTVRNLAARAGVSTRSFYQHYSDKEECFLAVYDAAVRRILSGLAAGNRETATEKQRLESAMSTLIREWDRDPAATRLMLVDVYEAGPAAIAHAQRTNRSIEAKIAAAGLSSLIARGILAGAMTTAQRKLLTERLFDMGDVANGLVGWALAYLGGSTIRLDELARISGRERWLHPTNTSIVPVEPSPSDDRALLVSAAEKLVAEGGEQVTEKAVWTAAGVPRRVFTAKFSNLDECLAHILHTRAERAISHAGKFSGSYRRVEALCREFSQDVVLREICFGEMTGWDAALKLRRHLEVKALLVEFIAESAGLSADTEGSTVEASVGAFWGVAQSEVVRGPYGTLPQLAGPLAYLILAPTIGPEETITAMRSEPDHAVQ
jgi:AcrR family transcriptional regulator